MKKLVNGVEVEMTPEEIVAFESSRGPGEESVPPAVSMRQARLALHAANLLASVETAIEQADMTARIEWEYATELRRDHPLVAQLGQTLELSEAEIDDLFTTASQL